MFNVLFSTYYMLCSLNLLGIFLIAVTCLAILAFGSTNHDYRHLWASWSSVFRFLLGKYRYRPLKETNSVIGPLYVLIFTFGASWTLANMVITILLDAFSEEQERARQDEGEEYELINHLIQLFYCKL